ASAFADSFKSGTLVEHPVATIADGIAVARPAERTLAIVKRYVDDVLTVTDEAIARTIVVLLERTKLLAEGAGAAALAAVLELDVIVDTRDRSHASEVLALVRGHGFPAEEILDTVPTR